MKKSWLVMFATVFVLAILAFADNKHDEGGAEIVADKCFTNKTAPFSATIDTLLPMVHIALPCTLKCSEQTTKRT